MGVTHRIIPDHLGSPRFVVDVETGGGVQEMRYDEFGRITLDTSPGFQPFGFAGGLYDHQTGLIRYGARDYDPEIGRWTIPDPSGFAGGLNLYVYADQNPQSFVDRSGEVPVAAGIAIAWGLIEAGLTTWDVYETGTTLMDPCASLGDKALSGGGLVMGAVGPGSGGLYKAAGNLGKKIREALELVPSLGGRGLGSKAPDQVMPGIRQLEGQYVDDVGQIQPWRAQYDEYGRQIERTDFTGLPDPATHANPHHHIRQYGPGYGPKGKDDSLPGPGHNTGGPG